MLFHFWKKNATNSVKLRAHFCPVNYSKISASPQAPHRVSFPSSPQECVLYNMSQERACLLIDWLQSLKQFFINASYHILVASLTLMALF